MAFRQHVARTAFALLCLGLLPVMASAEHSLKEKAIQALNAMRQGDRSPETELAVIEGAVARQIHLEEPLKLSEIRPFESLQAQLRLVSLLREGDGRYADLNEYTDTELAHEADVLLRNVKRPLRAEVSSALEQIVSKPDDSLVWVRAAWTLLQQPTKISERTELTILENWVRMGSINPDKLHRSLERQKKAILSTHHSSPFAFAPPSHPKTRAYFLEVIKNAEEYYEAPPKWLLYKSKLDAGLLEALREMSKEPRKLALRKNLLWRLSNDPAERGVVEEEMVAALLDPRDPLHGSTEKYFEAFGFPKSAKPRENLLNFVRWEHRLPKSVTETLFLLVREDPEGNDPLSPAELKILQATYQRSDPEKRMALVLALGPLHKHKPHLKILPEDVASFMLARMIQGARFHRAGPPDFI